MYRALCSLERQAVPTLERVLISAPCIQRWLCTELCIVWMAVSAHIIRPCNLRLPCVDVPLWCTHVGTAHCVAVPCLVTPSSSSPSSVSSSSSFLSPFPTLPSFSRLQCVDRCIGTKTGNTLVERIVPGYTLGLWGNLAKNSRSVCAV